MDENNRAALRAGMALTSGERVKIAIRTSRLATEFAAAPLRPLGDREQGTPTRG